MKINQFGRSLLPISFFFRMVQMSRCFLTTCTKPLHEEKNIKQMCRYKNECGRSMIEMLGVLVIIGVLSVGAIAGYSKAMKKHKLNVQAQGLSLLLQNSINFTSGFKMEEGANINISAYLNKLKVIPDGFKYNEKNESITDNFSSTLRLESCTEHLSQHNFGLRYYIAETDYRFDICVNLINIAKEFTEQIHYLTITNGEDPQINYYGKRGCNGSNVCLSKLTIDDIYQMCQKKNQNSAMFSFSWF